MKPKLSIIYVYYNTPQELSDSIDSLRQALGKVSYEVVVVNNNATKKIPATVQRNKVIRVINLKKNIGYGAGANRGAAVATGEYILIANPDVVFHKFSISRMIGVMEKKKKIGLIGPKYLNGKGSILPSVSGYPKLPGAIVAFSLLDKLLPGNSFSKSYWMRSFDYEKERTVPAVGGACMLFRKSVFEKIDGFDERFFMYFEEADISLQIKKAGYKIMYLPSAVITHMIGRSTKDSQIVQRQYEKSRFDFFKKYHGLVAAAFGEGAIRILRLNMFILLSIIAVSLFLNLYRINEYMMFYGDFGRDLLVARNMLLTGNIPLLGIPSSVVWLHQGPLSIYLMSIALFFGNFSPVAPAVLYALMGVGSTYMVYILGKNFFSEKIGLISAALYATSPIVIMNAREPYHTAPIPFFTLLFFLSFWRVIKKDTRYVLPSFFLLGLLLQLELSNVVIIIVFFVTWWYYRLAISGKIVLFGIVGFLLGIAPFILHDITHKFIQIGGLALWIVNRIRLFFGLTTSGNATTHEVGNALVTIWSEIVRVIYPLSPTIVAWTIVVAIVVLLLHFRRIWDRKNPNGLFVISLWLGIAIVGYLIHAKPGSAYFPVLYPAIIMLTGYAFYQIYNRIPVSIIFFVIMIGFNSYYLLINNYFLATPASTIVPNLYGYHYGLSLEIQEQAVTTVVKNANGEPFFIYGGGFLRDFATSVDNYRYLALWKGGKVQENAKIKYIIYQKPVDLPDGRVIYQDTFLVIIRK